MDGSAVHKSEVVREVIRRELVAVVVAVLMVVLMELVTVGRWRRVESRFGCQCLALVVVFTIGRR